jgi:ABC-2 type transport system permease protein
MSADRTLAVMRRVLRQVRRDRRTLAMIFVMPALLLWLVHAMFSDVPGTFGRVGPLMLGFFPYLLMFIITSIAVLRERTQGTLDRLMSSPIGRGDLLAGYALAFMVLALAQTLITLVVALWLLDMPNAGSLWLAFTIVSGLALSGTALGLFLSAFARTEFQAVQFVPAVLAPQVLLGGLFVPLARMPRWLELVARVLPLTYAFEALDRSMRRGLGLSDTRLQLDVLVVGGIAALCLCAGAVTLRRSAA